jgi:hypothetical protein
MKAIRSALLTVTALLVSCGPSNEESAAASRASHQQKCGGFGFAPGTNGFANCMMSSDQNDQAQQAADQRARKERDAARLRDCSARVAAANPPVPGDDALRTSILLDGAKVRAGCV